MSTLSNTCRLLWVFFCTALDEADGPEFATLAGLCFQIDLSDEAAFLYTRLEFSLQFWGTEVIYSLNELLVSESLMVGHKQ